MADRDELNLTAAFDFARDTLNSLVFVNGGAVVALLAFYGGQAGRAFTGQAFAGLLLFTLGVTAAVTSSLSAYIAQLNFGWSEPNLPRGRKALKSAIMLATMSLAMFVAGAVTTGLALEAAS